MVHSAPIGGVSSPAAPAISVSLAGVDIPALNGLIGLSQSEVKYVAFLAAGIPLGYLWSRCPRGTGERPGRFKTHVPLSDGTTRAIPAATARRFASYTCTQRATPTRRSSAPR